MALSVVSALLLVGMVSAMAAGAMEFDMGNILTAAGLIFGLLGDWRQKKPGSSVR